MYKELVDELRDYDGPVSWGDSDGLHIWNTAVDLTRRAADAIEELKTDIRNQENTIYELAGMVQEYGALCKYLAERLDSPCNFSPTDEEMFEFCGDDCGKADIECWHRVAKMAAKNLPGRMEEA